MKRWLDFGAGNTRFGVEKGICEVGWKGEWIWGWKHRIWGWRGKGRGGMKMWVGLGLESPNLELEGERRGGMKAGEDLGLETPNLGLERPNEGWDGKVGDFGAGKARFETGGGKGEVG